MYLGIRTDSPEAELYLYNGKCQVAEYRWSADRQLARDLLGRLEKFLRSNKLSFDELTGLIVYEGPGSFTGLRIGMSVLNAVAYAQSIPIVAASGETWADDAVERLLRSENDQLALPNYGAEARITQPNK